MKKLTKISIALLVFFIISSAYAFAAFIGHQIKPLPAPANYLILGLSLLTISFILKHLMDE